MDPMPSAVNRPAMSVCHTVLNSSATRMTITTTRTMSTKIEAPGCATFPAAP